MGAGVTVQGVVGPHCGAVGMPLRALGLGSAVGGVLGPMWNVGTERHMGQAHSAGRVVPYWQRVGGEVQWVWNEVSQNLEGWEWFQNVYGKHTHIHMCHKGHICPK